MKPFLIRWLVTTIAVMVVSQLSFVGIHADSIPALIVAGLFLGVMNAVVRPLLLLLTLPLLLLTMGLFFFFINALLLWLAGELVSGFHVNSFGSAFFGSIFISIVSWIFSAIFFPGSRGGLGQGGGGVRIMRMGPMQPPEREPGRGPGSGGGMKSVQGRVIEPDEHQGGRP